MKQHAAALAVGLALLAPAAFACGHCIEDRAAMVYDHGVVTAARDGNRRMALYGIEGPAERLAQAAPVLKRALASVPGVNERSVRISAEAAAFSFSYDSRATPAQTQALLDAALAPLGLRTAPLQLGP